MARERTRPDQPKAGFRKSVRQVDEPHAPIIYVDCVGPWGLIKGVGVLTLMASRHMIGADQRVETDYVAQAHLRFSIKTAAELHDALGRILMAASKPESEQVN
jgi:hypothetical protein